MSNCSDDSENFQLETRTEPRSQKRNRFISEINRVPLQTLNNVNDLNSVPKFTEKISLSEPVNRLKIRSRFIENNALESEGKVEHNQDNFEKLNAATLAKILDHDTFIEDEMGACESDELKLFNFLEKEGRLSPNVLKAFCRSKKIRTINMTSSYAGIKCQSGQILAAKYSAKLCTKSFYNGFNQLLSIDFTNVKIGDDELRYLIKLHKLQALGLSGTSITDKGIKYISIHSNFKTTLKCIKLCYIDGISDCSTNSLNVFAKLRSLDLRGNQNISLSGCLNLIKDAQDLQETNFSIKLPQNVCQELSSLHDVYGELSKNYASLILDPRDSRIDKLSRTEIKSQLKIHANNYDGIYLNQEIKCLHSKLMDIIKRREKEERLYKYNLDK